MHEQISPVTSSTIPPAELRLYCGLDHNAYDSELELEALAAIDYIEARTDAVLINREIEATYYPGELLRLRGPNTVVSGVSVDGVLLDEDTYHTTQIGNLVTLHLKGSQYGNTSTSKVVVVYTAGYETLTALVRKSIKSYVATNHRNREFASQQQLHEVAHGLEDAINVLNRGTRVG